MECMEITRDEETGDIDVRCDRPMTVANLIEALKSMPQDAVVYRYCDWTVERVSCVCTGSEGVGLL